MRPFACAALGLSEGSKEGRKVGKEEEEAAQMSRDIILAFRHGVLLQGPSSVERAREDVSNECSDVNVMEP